MAKRQLMESAKSKVVPDSTKVKTGQKKEDMWWETTQEILNEFEFPEFSVFERIDRWWIQFYDKDDDVDIIVLEDIDEKIKFKENDELLELGITQEKFDELKGLIECDD